MKIEELKQLYEIAEKLGNGKDPSTNLSFSEDTILNSKTIKKYNRQVAKILFEIIATAEKAEDEMVLKNRKLEFYLSEEEKKKIKFSKTPVSISQFVYSLNGMIGSHVKKLHAVDVTSWLQRQGYLEQCEMENGHKYKVATLRGNEIGITNEKRINSFGNVYSVNLYNDMAQRFVVNNLTSILDI